MRAIGLGSVSLVMVTLLVTDAADAASNAWCASYRRGVQNCSYATQQQCLAQVWGLGGFCRPNRFRARRMEPATPGAIAGDVQPRARQDAKLEVTAMAWLVPGQLIRQARVGLTPVRPVER